MNSRSSITLHVCLQIGPQLSKFSFSPHMTAVYKQKTLLNADVYALHNTLETLDPFLNFSHTIMELIIMFTWLHQKIKRMKKKVYFPNSTGWTPKKPFCFPKSVHFRMLSPHRNLFAVKFTLCSQVVKQWSA